MRLMEGTIFYFPEVGLMTMSMMYVIGCCIQRPVVLWEMCWHNVAHDGVGVLQKLEVVKEAVRRPGVKTVCEIG